ncbi:DUF2199 domain-containing protein [bacterium]|nr:MAG: DUF2199 domain-containing protein [bacterium]
MRWPWKKGDSFVCPTCGKPHEGLPSDYGYQLPDELWALSPVERQAHLDWSTDIAFLQGRWFIKGVLELPFRFEESRFGWGVWAEVPEDAVKALYAFDRGDPAPNEPMYGWLATDVVDYPKTSGLDVRIEFSNPALRPLFNLEPDSGHPLARQQRDGLDSAEYHAILRAIGSED